MNLKNEDERGDKNLRYFSSLVRWTVVPFKETETVEEKSFGGQNDDFTWDVVSLTDWKIPKER